MLQKTNIYNSIQGNTQMFFLFYVFYIHAEEFVDDVKNVSEYTDIHLLLAIQILLKSSDSKDFVDRPTKRPIEEVVKEFEVIQKKLGLEALSREVYEIDADALHTHLTENAADFYIKKKKKEKKEQELDKIAIISKFVEDNFYPVGYDIIKHEAEDYIEKPRFLENLQNKELIDVSKALHNMWNELSRKKLKLENNGSSTLFDLPYPFIIPGGRFREYYYWDTYWILEGLMVSDMYTSAKNIVKNFIYIINKYGYIPNGTRKYYLYRSQPPYFTMMLLKLLDDDGNQFNDLVFDEGLKAAVKEYEFWMKYKSVEIEDENGEIHTLNRYHVPSNFPRPESFAEDIITFEKQYDKSEIEIFSNIKSGAESGWDFSSRWLEDEKRLNTIQAFDQVACDLNAILYRNEIILSTLHSRKGEKKKALYYLDKSEKRMVAINAILWNKKENIWMDYVVTTKKHVSQRFYFSNLVPLIYGIQPPKENYTAYDVLLKYAKEIFGYPGGIPASGDNGVETLQQWDFPNVWAPHQHMMVEYLINIDEEKLAYHVARQFFNSVYEGYKVEKEFYEKYNCLETGSTGLGGEYTPQTGFGWTNGTALSFVLKFGDKLAEAYDNQKEYTGILGILEDKVRKSPTEPVVPESAGLVPNHDLQISIKTVTNIPVPTA